MTRPGPITPITTSEFADAMQAFAPFEPASHVAVAVSGGADSMALALLMDRWCRAKGGTVTALIVDHGLRPESATEAALAAARLAARGIPARVLVWQGEKPATGIQSAARQARYALLDGWCRQHGVLHLAAGHHAGDQVETFMMRLQRGSGPDGLAAMLPVRELSSCRLLRPLLAFPKSRLEVLLRTEGVAWTEDPSNHDTKYARTVIRNDLAASGGNPLEIAIATQRFARVRQALDTVTAEWLARHADLMPAGCLTFELEPWRAVNEETRLRILARAAHAVGGKVYAPDLKALERLAVNLEAGKGATLGRARFDVVAGHVGVFREMRQLPEPRRLTSGDNRWDGRFTISVDREYAGVMVLPWSTSVAGNWPRQARPAWYRALSGKARTGLPVFRSDDGYFVRNPGVPKNVGVSVRFAPQMALSGGGFSVA